MRSSTTATRLIVRRDGKAVRLFTWRGHDWTDRYQAIAGAAAKLRAKSFTLDGEAVVSGQDGVAVFDALHRRHKATHAMLYAFDLLELNGEDLRPLPLGERKAKLARAPAGIVFNEHTDEDGAVVFRHACTTGSFRAAGTMTPRRFPPPWTVIEHAESFWVRDASGQTVGWFYFRTDPLVAKTAGNLQPKKSCR